jgi:hypothetical protein
MDEDHAMPVQPVHFTQQTIQLLTDDDLQTFTTMAMAESGRRESRRLAAPYVEKLREIYASFEDDDDDALSLRIRAALDSQRNGQAFQARTRKADAETALSTIPGVTFSGITVSAGTVRWKAITATKTVTIDHTLFKISVSRRGQSTRAGQGDFIGLGRESTISIEASVRMGETYGNLAKVVVEDTATLVYVRRHASIEYDNEIINAIRHFIIDIFSHYISGIEFDVSPTINYTNNATAARLWTTGTANADA